MRLIIAHSDETARPELQAARAMLIEKFEADGWMVQELALPPIAEPDDQLQFLASCRLIPLAGMSDALLCLDEQSAVLRHPRKCIWLLDGEQSVAGPKSNGSYIGNVLRAALVEAKAMFAPEPVAKRMRAAGWKEVARLDPAVLKTGPAAKSKSGKRNESLSALLAAVRG